VRRDAKVEFSAHARFLGRREWWKQKDPTVPVDRLERESDDGTPML
jgi:hypothetical protein